MLFVKEGYIRLSASLFFARREIELFLFLSLRHIHKTNSFLRPFSFFLYFLLLLFILFMYVCASFMCVVLSLSFFFSFFLFFKSTRICIHRCVPLPFFIYLFYFFLTNVSSHVYVRVCCMYVSPSSSYVYMVYMFLSPKLLRFHHLPLYGLQFCVRVDMHRAGGISFCILHV